MTKRARKKRLRPAERLLAECCRLYLTRPRGAPDEAELEGTARSMITLGLVTLLYEWTQVGPGRLRPYWVKDVRLVQIAEHHIDLHATGVIEWSRGSGDAERVEEESFGLVCPVPDRYRTAPSVRPVVLLAKGDASAA
jgi:hypothetical protein